MASINEQAARWAVRADAGSLQPDEQRELDAWLGADPRHRGAYIRARAQWADLDRLAALHGPASQAAPREDYRAVSRRGLLAAGVATLAAVGGGLSWFVLRRAPASYASAIGEVRRISLEDGSTLLLNTATEVTVAVHRSAAKPSSDSRRGALRSSTRRGTAVLGGRESDGGTRRRDGIRRAARIGTGGCHRHRRRGGSGRRRGGRRAVRHRIAGLGGGDPSVGDSTYRHCSHPSAGTRQHCAGRSGTTARVAPRTGVLQRRVPAIGGGGNQPPQPAAKSSSKTRLLPPSLLSVCFAPRI